MAYEGPHVLKLTGVTASADLSGKQFYFVKLSGTNTVDVCSNVADVPVGVLQNKPTSGQEAEVVCIGVTKVSGDADLASGNLIGTSADGQAAAYSSAAAQTKYCVGQVIQDNGAAGGLATVVINCANLAHGGS